MLHRKRKSPAPEPTDTEQRKLHSKVSQERLWEQENLGRYLSSGSPFLPLQSGLLDGSNSREQTHFLRNVYFSGCCCVCACVCRSEDFSPSIMGSRDEIHVTRLLWPALMPSESSCPHPQIAGDQTQSLAPNSLFKRKPQDKFPTMSLSTLQPGLQSLFWPYPPLTPTLLHDFLKKETAYIQTGRRHPSHQ